MNRIGIRELRDDLSNQVRKAASGESIVITIDGQPMAVVAPFVEQPGSMTLDELEAAGRLIRGPRVGEPKPPPPPRVKGECGKSMSEILDEIREDRF